ncbi:MAG: ribonuclease D [Mariprofundaceae bacterium]
MTDKFVYIDTSHALQQMCHELEKEPVLYIDTEFHRENTYSPDFALLQISGGKRCFIVDPLTIESLDPLWQLLHRPESLKVLHAGRQDIEIILEKSGEIPRPLFDTQVAASLLGYGQQIGFGNLLQRLRNISLPKAESFSDWLARPLRPEQLTYAADDVIYLIPMYQQLNEELQTSGRRDWLDQEQAVLTSLDTYTMDPQNIFWRVKGSNRLKAKQLAILRELAAWRELAAQKRNLPRRRVLSDEILIELSRGQATTREHLERIRGLNSGVIRRFGDDILAVVQCGREMPSEKWPELPARHHNTVGTDLRQEMLSTLVRLRAEDEQISAPLLASKGEMTALASWAKKTDTPPPDLPCLQGWRRDLIGEDMLALLQGNITLRLDRENKMPVIERLT